MTSTNTHPKWWQLYLTFPILIALFILDHRLKISTRGHQAVQIGIILIVYGLIYWWIKSNSAALSRMDKQHHYGRVIVAQIPSPQISDENDGNRPMFQLANSEIKGMLSDTFEMDAIDAKSLPLDNTSEELNKE
jgi:hypothetical protein